VDNTCSGCCSGTKTFDPCTEYQELSSKERNVKYNSSGINLQDYGEKTNPIKMADWNGRGWYRFTGEAGDKMAESFPGYNKCGTKNPAYLLVNRKNKLPLKGRGKSMEVCRSYKYYDDSCKYKDSTTVMNCGDYFLYKLGGLVSDVYCGV